MKKTSFQRKLSKQFAYLSNTIGIAVLFLNSFQGFAQSNSQMISSEPYLGGYHIKCNGENDGSLEVRPNFGSGPYTYLWNSGETNSKITNKAAGIYFVKVTDINSVEKIDTFELKQPEPLAFELKVSDYNGFNVSTNGNNDGIIELLTNGGTPPYRYEWNTGENTSIRKNLVAGNYSFTITDANGCIVIGNTSISEPLPLQVSFSNTQNVSCFKANDGKTTLNISGGLGDYSVVWENGSFSFSPDNLVGGFNAVRIYERGKAILDTGVTLTEPNMLECNFTLSQYNGFNVSCVDCFNGSINTSTEGGTTPYNYLWNDANQSTSANLSNLNGGEYVLIVKDAHGCESKNNIFLTMPSPKDWSRNGNSNIEPSEFIGSADNSPVVFKANNQEVLQLKNDTVVFNAKIKLLDIETASSGEATDKVIGVDDNGNLKLVYKGEMIQGVYQEFAPCYGCGCKPTVGWGVPTNLVGGTEVPQNTNDIVKCPSEGNVGIGTSSPQANSKLDIVGDIAISGSRLNVSYNGNVGIGTNLPKTKLEIKTSESDLISFGNIRTEVSGWATSYLGLNTYRASNGMWRTTDDTYNSGGSIIYSNAYGDLMFTNINGESITNGVTFTDAGLKQQTKMTLTNNGVLGIGVNPKINSDLMSYKLVVDGNIKCKKLRVDLQNWADYVFDSKYELMDLAGIEDYINKNKHLPGMPSAEKIEKEGVDLGEMIKLQQVKIEELTLLLIQMKKQIDINTNNK
jgi:hypothetical protein